MFQILLVIIYFAFISLGLPDSLLGASWPSMYQGFGVPLSYAGVIAMIIAVGTVVSSLLSDRLTRKFGTGLVTAISVLMTAAALFGFSVSHSFWMLCLWAIPYGFGAGSVDAGVAGAAWTTENAGRWLVASNGAGRAGGLGNTNWPFWPAEADRSACAGD